MVQLISAKYRFLKERKLEAAYEPSGTHKPPSPEKKNNHASRNVSYIHAVETDFVTLIHSKLHIDRE